MAAMTDEATRVENQAMEKAMAEEKELNEKQERRRREMSEIKRSRSEQLRRKQLAREESEKDETEWSAQWQVAKERLTEEEEAERGWVRQRNVDVTNFNIQLRERRRWSAKSFGRRVWKQLLGLQRSWVRKMQDLISMQQ